MDLQTHRLWSGFDRDSLSDGSLENVLPKPGRALRAELLDPSRPGLLMTPPIRKEPFDRAIVSWNGFTPPGARLELDLRAEILGRWTRFYPLAVWSSNLEGPRHSCPGHEDEDGGIDTDMLRLTRSAEALQIRVKLLPGLTGESPVLTGLVAALSDSQTGTPSVHRPPGTWGLELDLPQRSQRNFPEGAQSWCSPVCVTMVLEYWGLRLGIPLADPIPTAARLTWDSAYGGSGNWPFNTAYASAKGLKAYVAQLADLAEAESFLRGGIPLVLSIGWREGELPGAHLPSSQGHLVVLRGFNGSGDPILNDPAAPEDPRVRTEYPRVPFEKAWSQHSGGIAYIIEPVDP